MKLSSWEQLCLAQAMKALLGPNGPATIRSATVFFHSDPKEVRVEWRDGVVVHWWIDSREGDITNPGEFVKATMEKVTTIT